MKFCSVWWLTLAVVFVSASSGDTAPDFKDCVSSCASKTCDLPIVLRLTQWTCLDDCKYRCMHTITDKAVTHGTHIQQYFGKWPFIRFAGIQEPASVLFSILNGLVHAQGALRIRDKVPSSHPLKKYYMYWAFISINAWTWSSFFHSRDFPITEKLDYFSAALAIVSALYLAVIRFFHIYPPLHGQPTSSVHAENTRVAMFNIWSLVCIVVFSAHIAYLVIPPRFDYAYNIAFGVIIGLIHNALWITYSFPSGRSPVRRFPFKPKNYRPRYAFKAAVAVILTTGASALEVFDFSPWKLIIDAHSLWHLATVPITKYWYSFLIEDSLDDGWRSQKA